MSKEVSNTTEVIEQVVGTTPTVVVDVAEKVAEKESFIKKNKWTLIGATALATTAALIGGLAYKRETPVAKEIADDDVVQEEQ